MTFLTSFFLHAGLFHLIGNLYFLLVFGDNTEDVLGKRRFLLLVAAAAVAGDITHILADPRATIPCVGASGGISGILAYYCLRFPTARVGLVGWFRWLRVPVRLMFAVWVAMQIIDAYWILEGIGDVAVFAHLGGATVGVLFWWWTQRAVQQTHYNKRPREAGPVALSAAAASPPPLFLPAELIPAFRAAGLLLPRVFSSSNSHSVCERGSDSTAADAPAASSLPGPSARA